jgi:hypothetical protein
VLPVVLMVPQRREEEVAHADALLRILAISPRHLLSRLVPLGYTFGGMFDSRLPRS